MKLSIVPQKFERFSRKKRKGNAAVFTILAQLKDQVYIIEIIIEHARQLFKVTKD